ncbi:MAG: OmpH family outer membrane protein [Chitinophagales bacterium]|jgi:outer membrane protein|nr:OmpH family outer membrane protein [Chitinophagales bacterium]
MKKTVLGIIVAVFALMGTASAQQKLGHINSIEVLQAMPEFKSMSNELQKQKDSYTKALENMYGDYEKKQADLQNLSKAGSGTPDAILESKIQELQDLQKRITDFEAKVNDDLQKSQQEKLKPINDKYLKAVKDVATSNGYAYILDIVQGSVAYYPEDQNNVTDLVMKKLGITPGAATQTAPAGGTAAPKK